MATLEAVRVKNLRCLSDTESVSLRPITLFVGRNSAGKSTFARLLPLLRQSAEEEKRSPILWYGRLVDFGNFETAVNKFSDQRKIEFSFKIKVPKDSAPSAYYYPFMLDRMGAVFFAEETEIGATICLVQSEKSKSCYASSVLIEIFGNKLEIVFSGSQKLDEIRVNRLVWQAAEANQVVCRVSQGRIFPRLKFFRQYSRKSEGVEKKFLRQVDPFDGYLRESLYESLAHRRTSSEKIDRLMSFIPIGSDENIIESLSQLPFSTKAFKRKVVDLNSLSSEFMRLRDSLYLRHLPQLLDLVDSSLNEILSGVRYLEPLRATAQRYYRIQELAIDELDSKGANVAMFIDSLSELELERLNAWLNEYFSVRLRPRNEGGHVAIELLKTDSKSGMNLADLGFGFSQLLPIIIQLWHSSQPNYLKGRRGMASASSIVVIEQPELHLHPAYQANMPMFSLRL